MATARSDPLDVHGKPRSAASLAEVCFPAPNWYHQQVEWVRAPVASDSVAYNYPLSFRVRGPLNNECLRQSLEAIVRRHEVLRSIFRVERNTLTQIVLRPRPFSLHEIDLAQTEASTRLPKAISLATETANCRFEMSIESLLRAMSIRLAADDHILLLVTHHIVCDDWSVAILLRELSLLYSTFSVTQAGADSLVPLPIVYGRFACDLASRLNGPEVEVRTRFWERQLRHAAEFHHLKPDYPRPSRRSFRSGAHECEAFPSALLGAIKKLGQQERVSPFMILLAAFECLLCRSSGQDDIGVATCVANRSSTELEALIAPLSNRVVLRADLSGNPTFHEILARVRDAALNAYSNQDVPFGAIVEKLSPTRDPSRNPLFQTLLVLQDAPQDSWNLGRSNVTWLPLDTGTTRYDLNVWLRFKSDKSLEADFQYDTGLFRASTIRKLIEDYRNILEMAVGNPQRRVRDLPARIQEEGQFPAIAESASRSPSAREDEMDSRLAEIWQELLGLEAMDTSTDFFAAGGDSLRAARLFARIERVFGIKLPVSTILEARTYGSLVRLLRSVESVTKTSSVVAVQPYGPRPPVFCIHNHTGDVLFCRSLPNYTRAGQPLYGLQSQALVGKAPHFSVEQMAESYVEDIQRIHPQGPCFLFGYSFGGLVAFEMSQMLLARGRDVAFLGMFNTPAPGSLVGWPLRQFYYVCRRTRNELEKLPQLGAKEKLAHLARNIANFQQMMTRSVITDAWRFSAKVFGKRFMERTGRALLTLDQINIAAAKAYNPKKVFPGTITFFLAEALPYLYAIPPQIGWGPFAADGIEIVNVPGESGHPAWEQFARTVAEKLNLRLEQIS